MAQMSGLAVRGERSMAWGAGSVGLSEEYRVMREAGGKLSNHCFLFGQLSDGDVAMDQGIYHSFLVSFVTGW